MQAVAPPPGGQRTSLTPSSAVALAASGERKPSKLLHPLCQKESAVTAALLPEFGAFGAPAQSTSHSKESPMATITLEKTIIKAGETAVVTFTVEKTHFMGTLNGHVRDAIVTGGTISGGYDFRYIDALSTATTQVYQGIFTPTANLDRTECTIRYDAPGTANDATSATFIVDTRAPTITGTPTIS